MEISSNFNSSFSNSVVLHKSTEPFLRTYQEGAENVISEDSSERPHSYMIKLVQSWEGTQGELERTRLLPLLLSKAVSPRPHTTGSWAGEPRLATFFPLPICSSWLPFLVHFHLLSGLPSSTVILRDWVFHSLSHWKTRAHKSFPLASERGSLKVLTPEITLPSLSLS